MKEVVQVSIVELISYLGGAVVLLSGIIIFTSKILQEKINSSIQHSYSKKLEELKSELSKNNKVLDNVQSIFLNNIKNKGSRTIEVLELLWTSTLIIKRNIPSPVYVVFFGVNDSNYNIDHLKMIKSLVEPSIYDQIIDTSERPYLDILKAELNKTEEVKCFISDELYNYYSVFKSVLGKAVYEIYIGVARNDLQL